jgi:hypothetical protein
MAVSSRIRLLFLLPFLRPEPFTVRRILYASGAKPFDNNGDSLPDLGMAAPTGEGKNTWPKWRKPSVKPA